MKTFDAKNGLMVKKLRLKLNLTQEQLGRELDISGRTVRRYESGHKPDSIQQRIFEAWIKEVEWQARVAKEGI